MEMLCRYYGKEKLALTMQGQGFLTAPLKSSQPGPVTKVTGLYIPAGQ